MQRKVYEIVIVYQNEKLLIAKCKSYKLLDKDKDDKL